MRKLWHFWWHNFERCFHLLDYTMLTFTGII